MTFFDRASGQNETESPVQSVRWQNVISCAVGRGRDRSIGWRRSVLCLVVVAGTLIGLLSIPPTRTSTLHLAPGHNITLTSGGAGTVTGTVTSYSPQELWGGGSEVEACAVCSPSGLLAKSGGQSTKPGQDVDAMMGDYTNEQDLFSVGAVGGDLAMNLTYDSGEAAAEHTSGGYAGPFGYGWSSTMSGAATTQVVSGVTNYIVTIDNGAQTTFQENTSGICPSTTGSEAQNDYESPQKYTISTSSDLFCAADRVDAQLGVYPTYGVTQLNESGGKEVYAYDAYGQLADVGNNATTSTDDLNFTNSVSPGATDCPTGSGITSCLVEVDEASGRHVTAENSGYGLVIAVFDPFGREYIMGYTDDDGNLNDIYSPSPAGGDATTAFAYSTTVGSPFNSDLTQITDPDGNKSTVSYSNGMVYQLKDPYGSTTTYTYEYNDCTVLPTPSTPNDCTVFQQTNVAYADGEYDLDEYSNGLIIGDDWGENDGYEADTEGWAFSYQEPGPSNQDAPIVETVTPPTGSTDPVITTDSVGNVLSYVDPAGITTDSLYNNTADVDNLDELCWSIPLAKGTSFPSNSCTSPPSGSTSYTYDADGHQLSETDPLGNTTHEGYYSNGILCWTALPTVTTSGTPCANNGTSPSGAPSGATTYTYDTQGDAISTTVPAAPSPAKTTTSEYDLDDDLLYSIPPNGQGAGAFGSNAYETADTYKPDGSLASSTGPLSRTDSYTYDAAGNVLTSSDPTGVTTNAYDQDNRLCWSYQAASAYGSSTCTSPPSTGATKYTGYHADTDAPTGVTDPDGATTTYAYGDDLWPTEATTTTEASVPTNPQSNIVTYDSYDTYDNLCMSGPVSPGAAGTCGQVLGDTYNDYNVEGQLNPSYDANGNKTTYVYTDIAFPTMATSVTNPLSRTTTYNYDADGNLTSTVDPKGQTTTTAYDADGRPCFEAPTATTNICAGPPTGTGVTVYGYDQASQRTSMTDNNGATGQVTDSYSYDANGNLLSASNDNAQTTKYAYDDANDPTCVTYPNVASSSCTPGSQSGSYVTRGYNTAGELSSTTDWLGNTVSYTGYNPLAEVGTITYPGGTEEAVAYTYDADGNVTAVAYSGSAISALNGVSDSYTPNADNQVQSSTSLGSYSSASDTYNTYGRLQQATNPATSGTGSQSGPDKYVTANNGEISTDTPPGKSVITYGYDAGDELQSISNPNNPTSTRYNSYGFTADGQRCLSVFGSSTYSGVTCGTVPTGSTVVGAYDYNAYGQLCWSGPATTSSPSCTSTPSGDTSYSYDGNDLRMTSKTGSTTTKFDWDTVDGGSTPLDISDGTNSYIYGPLLFGGTAPIEQVSASGVSFLASTPTGVQAVFSSTPSVRLQELAAYSAYGVQTIQSGTNVTPFGFQGSYTDPSGLIYLIDRYYDPATEQFLAIDPDVAETGQPYAFTGDDPLNATDPLGTMVNGGPGELIAGNSATSAKDAESLETADRIQGVIHNSAVFNAQPSGPVSSVFVNVAFGLGLLVPGFDDGPDEGLLAVADEADGAAAASDEDGASLSGRLNTARDAYGDVAIRNAMRVPGEPGYFDVIGHGTPADVSGMSASELASEIQATPSWEDQNVRLLSCSTGCPSGTYAQDLANELGVTVQAPTSDFLVSSRGGISFLDGGGWAYFSPVG
jgi:RHS repeat-associated protein